MRHIIPISGKDSLATALLQTSFEPDLPYEFMFNDVKAELPETYEWIAEVERKTGWQIHRVGSDLPAKIRLYSGFLPGPRSRYCTREAKIKPMLEWLGGATAKDQLATVAIAATLKSGDAMESALPDEAIIYYGLRADEKRTGFVPVGGQRITPKYPLQDAGIDLRGVYAILDAQQLTPPTFFWPRLHEAVCQRLRDWAGWEDKLNRMERDILFAGRSRGNCSFCFFQRQYEWVWLHEIHPDLFEEACAYENVGSDYKWRPDYSLPELIARREIVFENRVSEVCKTISRRLQLSLFEVEENEIALTSCGLLCGK